MQTTKKMPSLIFILVGAVLAGYLGYLINGAWTEGIAFNEFMDRFNEVCAVPFANYYNSNTVKAVAIALGIYAMAIVMYYTSQRNYMPGKEFGTARFENPKQVNKILADKDENFNRILSQNVKMSLDFRRLKLNGNILICGGSGAGKTFYEVKPNLMQMPHSLKVGDTVMAGPNADIKPGNALPFENIPVGTMIHNIELYPGKGGQLVRSAGVMAQLMAKENGYALVRLPSGEMRNVRLNCIATIGVVSNLDHENVNLGKAGRKRHMGVRPGSRGAVMNPCDHPHGGGEGRAPVGHSSPRTPWGKPALGLKTRKHKARSDKFIVKRANG